MLVKLSYVIIVSLILLHKGNYTNNINVYMYITLLLIG